MTYVPSSRMAKLLYALTLHLVPSLPDLDLSGIENKVIADTAKILGEFHPLFRRIFLFGLWLFEWLPCFFGFGLKPFTHLSFDNQEKYIKGWAHSRLLFKRELFKGIRGLILLTAYSDKRIWSYIGYDPEPHMAERIGLRKQIMEHQEQQMGVIARSETTKQSPG